MTPPITDIGHAALDLLGRCGARTIEFRYSGTGANADQPPIAWIALAVFAAGFECAAAPDPQTALLRLCHTVIDGGTCTHCERTTGFDADHDDTINLAITGQTICWYMYDPELRTFRRSCE